MTQQEALEVLKSGKNVFLTGEPGSGKTYTINQFIEWCEEEGKTCAITASTGIAATHIGGVTIHSWSGIKMKRKITENHLADMGADEWLVKKINGADVLIVDEVSMLDARFISMIDKILKWMRIGEHIFEPFGGMQVIFVGDFFQLPPVPTRGEGRPLFAFEAMAWREAKFEICYLTEQHRQSEPEYLDILGSMRKGVIAQNHRERLQLCKMEAEPLTHLYTHNDQVDEENNAKLRELQGEEHKFQMEKTGVHATVIEFFIRNLLTPELLRLKVGARVMFTRNKYDPDTKEMLWCNGTLGTVIDFDPGPVIQTKDGEIIRPKREKWTQEENGRELASATQYPLKLAWAISVHKSQGMSLDEASVDLSNAFEYGQGYVALSRVRSLSGLHLRGTNEMTFKMHPKVIEKDKEFRRLSH